MILQLATFLQIAAACAPHVAPETLAAVAGVESGFNPLAISVNSDAPGMPHVGELHAVSRTQALRVTRLLVDEQHRSVDLGLMQINAGTLRALGLSFEDAFDPCQSVAAAGRLLVGGYLSAGGLTGETPQKALRKALSMYNTGTMNRGFMNGYVRRVEAAAVEAQAALPDGTWHAPVTQAPLPPVLPRRAATVGWPSPWPATSTSDALIAEAGEPRVLDVAYRPSEAVEILVTPSLPTQIVFAADEQADRITILAPSAWIAFAAGNLLFVKPLSAGTQTEMRVTTSRANGSPRDYRFMLNAVDISTDPDAGSGFGKFVFTYPDPAANPAPARVQDVHPSAHPRITRRRST